MYKCKVCQKKILEIYKDICLCKCNNLFCMKHISSSVHQCTYLYHDEHKKDIQDKLPLVTYTKNVKI